MKKFFTEIKTSVKKLDDQISSVFNNDSNDHNGSGSPSQSPNTTAIMTAPTPDDVVRYRYHHGCNFGGVFVLEKWMTEDMFPPGWNGGGSELDAVIDFQRKNGLETTREKWEANWRNAVTDAQLRWLAIDAKVTSIRLPIGYFTLGPQWCNDTPFAEVASVYVNAWAAVRDLTRRAKDWGIGVLVDFHGVYGGANDQEHSGTTTKRAELWTNGRNQERAIDALRFIAEEVKSGSLTGVVGIQLCNEAVHNANGMYQWYDLAIKAIGRIDESIPLYISDGWDLETCLQWINNRNPLTTSPKNPIIIDTHKYYTFSQADWDKTPQQITGALPGEFQELQRRSGSLLSSKGEGQVIVGEWSCVMDGKTWARVGADERDDLVKQFGQAQCKAWCEKTGGCYFWTYRSGWNGGEWSFEEQTRKGNVVAPNFLQLPSREALNRVRTAQDRRAQLGGTDRSNHENYWNSASPGKKFQHELYSAGWDLGYSDAMSFFKMRAEGSLGANARDAVGGGDKIGCLDVWTKKRLLESNARGEFVWEWEQGFRQGVASFYSVVGF